MLVHTWTEQEQRKEYLPVGIYKENLYEVYLYSHSHAFTHLVHVVFSCYIRMYISTSVYV